MIQAHRLRWRLGTAFQAFQPGAAQVPGLVIFGENDAFLTKPSIAGNLAVVRLMREKYQPLWNFARDPRTGHGPGEKTWPLVLSFLPHTFTARVPAGADRGGSYRSGRRTGTPWTERGFRGGWLPVPARRALCRVRGGLFVKETESKQCHGSMLDTQF